MKCQICDTDNTKKECLHYNKVMSTENNKLIAEFMQLVECETDYLYHPSSEKGFLKDYLMYNSDWNWLMEVVEKILYICSELDEMEMYYTIIDKIPSIDSVYNACVEFIKWYNAQNK